MLSVQGRIFCLSLNNYAHELYNMWQRSFIGFARSSTGGLAADFSAAMTGVAAAQSENANQVVSYTSGGVTQR